MSHLLLESGASHLLEDGSPALLEGPPDAPPPAERAAGPPEGDAPPGEAAGLAGDLLRAENRSEAARGISF